MLIIPDRWRDILFLILKFNSITYFYTPKTSVWCGLRLFSYTMQTPLKSGLRSKFSRVSWTIWTKFGLYGSFFTPLKPRCGKALRVLPWAKRSKSAPNLLSMNPIFKVFVQICSKFFYWKRGLWRSQTPLIALKHIRQNACNARF